VVSRDCNQRCPHCYNNSEPGAPGLTIADVSTCIAHLPAPGDVAIGRIILSGGEVLVWPELLLHTLSSLHDRYGDRTQLMATVDQVRQDMRTLRSTLSCPRDTVS
jgi:MoaA/NifB/PqqE/SkfB family radical SAM enzyme